MTKLIVKKKSLMRTPVGGFCFKKSYPYWTFIWNGEMLNIEDMGSSWLVSDGFTYCSSSDGVMEAIDGWDDFVSVQEYDC